MPLLVLTSFLNTLVLLLSSTLYLLVMGSNFMKWVNNNLRPYKCYVQQFCIISFCVTFCWFFCTKDSSIPKIDFGCFEPYSKYHPIGLLSCLKNYGFMWNLTIWMSRICNYELSENLRVSKMSKNASVIYKCKFLSSQLMLKQQRKDFQ